MTRQAHSKWLRRAVEAKPFCAYCDCKVTYVEYGATFATLDHIVPQSKGGSSHGTNLTLACLRCNRLKDNFSVEKFIEKAAHLRLEVHVPGFTICDILGTGNQERVDFDETDDYMDIYWEYF